MDADLAANKLNELFHLHRYEDCVLFLNRLSHSTIRLVISQISIDMYLSRLPYTIEIFEAMYAKIFIIDPDNFPTRSLQPERLIDKMVCEFGDWELKTFILHLLFKTILLVIIKLARISFHFRLL